jgi:luciferase family oxidoreductase group 1
MGNKRELKLSVLDQSPVAEGTAAAQALQNSIALARRVDELGYRRFWMSEHHAMDLLACTAPEILLARIGAETSRIRIGSGGIMLPHYTPLKVAEVFRTLYGLYPERVDLGIGRAPGKVAMEDDFPEQVTELLAFLEDDFPTAHPFAKVKAMPAPVPEDRYAGPAVWMLGSSMWSSAAAVEFGLPYSFAHFFSPVKTRDAIEAYMRNFRPGIRLEKPEATVAVGVICAETQEEAEFLSASVKLLQQRIRLGERKPVAAPEEALRELQMRGEMPLEEGEWPRYFVGTPRVVRERLEQMAGELGIDEVIVNTIVWDHEKRIRSYEMLAKEFELG